MAHVKSKWYRDDSKRYVASDLTIERQDNEYLKWLARQRGWFTTELQCDRCRGSGKSPGHYGGRWRDYECSRCHGVGFITMPPDTPDVKRARECVADQRAELEDIAWRAAEGIKHRLFWHGLRPVVTTWGYTDESRWWLAMNKGQIYVGTRNPSRYHGSTKPDVSIIIKPGRAPSSYELDVMAEGAVAVISGGLELAA